MVPATRQCATCTGVVVSRVAATATASVIFTSVRYCFRTAAQLAAAVRWACAVLAMVAEQSGGAGKISGSLSRPRCAGGESVACAGARGRSSNASVPGEKLPDAGNAQRAGDCRGRP